MSEKITYKASGVDIEAGREAVRRLGPHARSTFRPEVLQDIGAFGGLFLLDRSNWREPVLVSATDGVGTKVKVAAMAGRYDTVGIDVVAYCVNDILCHGAQPLFFLDYIGVGRLDPAQAEAIVAGVAEGCRQAGCALVGGETAEMPGVYKPGEFDLAGFAVGAVEREELIDGSKASPGDAIIGIASTGLQASGFSLVRRVVFEEAGLAPDQEVAELGGTVADALLTPTYIYARTLSRLREACQVQGIANISGGGLPENLPRAMPEGTHARLRKGSWPVPPVFGWLQRLGGIGEEEMFRTFNMGVGMTVIVPAGQVEQALEALHADGREAFVIGEVVEGPKGVSFE